ncbi:MAG: hypothetical protein VR66_05740 [Peptococcaceae bacterium BRH_c23]|nr:MAG: hypothetical protein VR66_05740 [Peptococcaceae bacterium BRH_c23]KJS87569.1 MAG: hypothetical protein JL57_13745 [Desulfosporosinus sp. BICA1-9]HBW36166.1 hypothetical protein [Desulfosporosinus sp.]
MTLSSHQFNVLMLSAKHGVNINFDPFKRMPELQFFMVLRLLPAISALLGSGLKYSLILFATRKWLLGTG